MDGSGQPEDVWHHVDMISSGTGDNILEIKMTSCNEETDMEQVLDCEFTYWDDDLEQYVCDYECQPAGGSWIFDDLGEAICVQPTQNCEHHRVDLDNGMIVCDFECGPNGGSWVHNHETNEMIC